MYWFTINWWKYLLQKSKGDIGYIRTFLCRVKGHPSGIVYYNPGGIEPDYHCRNCDDDLS
jgi:hypothetical protein